MRLKHTVTLLVASFGTAGAALCSGLYGGELKCKATSHFQGQH